MAIKKQNVAQCEKSCLAPGLQTRNIFDQLFAKKLQVRKKIKFLLCWKYTPKHVASGEAYLCDLAPGQYSSDETSQRWRAVGDTVIDLTSLEIEPQTFCIDSGVLTSTIFTGR